MSFKRMPRRPLGFWAVFCVLGFSSMAFAQSKLAIELSSLRAEVDGLAAELADSRRAGRDVLASLRAERGELERQIRLERVRAETLKQVSAERQRRLLKDEGMMLGAAGPIRSALIKARGYVKRSLPFMRDARLEGLARIESELNSAAPDLARVLDRLWRFVEEEEATAKEFGLAKQAILLGEKRLLVDVLHFGMALLYFQTRDGRVGWAVAHDGIWEFELLRQDKASAAVRTLFSDYEKNKRIGAKRFLLPGSAL